MKQVGLAAAFLLVCVAVVSGQVTSGRLSGTVVDPQGAAAPGAVVTVVNQQIKRTFSVTTDERGQWAVASVPTATYRVTVNAPGFKTAVVADVGVDAATPATVNVTLELGDVAETVEVAAGAEILQTSTATVNATLTGRQIHELPFTTRNALELILSLPGTQTPGTPRTSSINGLPMGTLNITLDGINIQDNLLKSYGFEVAILPKSDAIEEVTVSTANPGADNSGEGAAQIKFVTRSGTNQYHGGGFWQHRNTALNANYYFNNIDGLPRDRIVLNQFGGRLGGPILKDRLFFFFSHEEFHLPQTYGARRTVVTPAARQGLFTYQDTVTRQLRTVNLYELAAAGNARLPGNIRPFAATPDPTVANILSEIERLSSQSGSLRSRIDTANDHNRFDFTFQARGGLARRFPTLRLDANLTNKHHLEFVYNYQSGHSGAAIPTVLPGAGSVLGHSPTAGARHGVYSAVTAVRSTLTPQLTSEVRVGIGGGDMLLFAQEIVPPLFAQWRGYAPGLAFVSSPFTASSQSRYQVPTWNSNANVTWSRGSHLWNFGGSFTQVYNWAESVGNQVIPSIGFGLAPNDPANTGGTSLFTLENFPNSTPGQRGDAAALYAVLTGRVSGIGRSVALDENTKTYGPFPRTDRNRQREFALYLQDSWRLRPSFTFNYGVRWDLQLPFVNLNTTYTRVGLEGLYGVSGVGNLFRPGVLTGTVPQYFPVESERGAYKTFTKQFSPSVGFAWRLPGAGSPLLKWLLGSAGGRSVLRAGYSIATVREGMDAFTSVWGSNQGRTLTASVDPSNFPAEFGPPGSVWFRDPVLPSRAVANRPSYPIPVLPGNSVRDFDPNLRFSYVPSWTLSFQRALGADTVLDVRYVGDAGVGLWRRSNLNEVNIFENGFLDEFTMAMNNLAIARRANPNSVNFGDQGLPGQKDIPIIRNALGFGSDTATATTIERGLAGSMASSIAFNTARMNRLIAAGYPPNFFVVNPAVGGAGSLIMRNGAHSTYHALQVDLRRRLSAGLLVQSSYVWSKSLTNMLTGGLATQLLSLRDPRLDKGPSPWDIRHAIKLNWIYELPFGPHRRYFSGARASVLRKALEGWEIAGVSRTQSGSPELQSGGRATFNQLDGGVILHNLTARQFQDLMKIRKDPRGSVYVLPQSFIDNTKAAFETGGKTLRDLDRGAPYLGPVTEPGRLGYQVFLYGPWQARWDMSVVKKTWIGERKNIEFRAQFLNALNTANFLFGDADNVVNFEGVGARYGETRDAYRDIFPLGANDPGGRLIEFVLRFNF